MRINIASAFVGLTTALLAFTSTATGAAKCYPAAGRFAVNAELVSDAMTGLVWHQAIAPQAMTFAGAQAYCKSLGSRVPSMTELYSLVDYAKPSMIDGTFFPNSPPDKFWTSSEFRMNAALLYYYLIFKDGTNQATDSNQTFQVRCVR